MIIGCGCEQANEPQPAFHRWLAQLRIFFCWQINNNQAVNASVMGVGHERLNAINIDRIIIAHQNDRRVGVTRAKLSHHRQGPAQGLSHFEGAQAGHLNGRAIGHGVGEGHAEFNDVGPRLGQACEDGLGLIQIWIPCRNERHESGPTFPFQGRKPTFDATV